MARTLSEANWHDGRLVEVAFSIDKKGRSAVRLIVLLYKNEQAPIRDTCQIDCSNVSRFNCTLDALELKDNMAAGNISNGYVKDQTLWLYFSDGILEVHAKRMRISEC